MKVSDKISLNKEQEEAAMHHQGPCMLLAGPGSGKTTVLTQRVVRLITRHLVPPGQILVITYTRAAAEEMQQRFLRITDHAFPGVTFGTFHAVFYKILQSAGFEENREGRKFLQRADALRLMKEVLAEAGQESTGDIAERLLERMSYCKNSTIDFTASGPGTPYAAMFPAICAAYERRRKERFLPGYDDIAPDCLKLLSDNRELLSMWRARFPYLLVDEYQDVCPVQNEIVRLLAAPKNNLFVVGDDDQSIYGFRGASPQVMRRFMRDYPGAKVLYLTDNYRSVPAVIDASLKVVEKNRDRFTKKLRSATPHVEGLVTLRAYEGAREEAEAILKELGRMKEGGQTDFSRVAVLFRTTAYAGELVRKLQNAGFPYHMQERIKSIYSTHPAREMCAFLRVATGAATREDLARLKHHPVFCAAEKKSALIGTLKSALAVSYIRRALGYEKYLQERLTGSAYAKSLQTLGIMQEDAAGYPEIRAFLLVCEEREAVSEQTAGTHSKKDGVRIRTIHAAKGLEYDTVFLPALNEGALPDLRAREESQISEERRMMYVAMTRARQALHLSFHRQGGHVVRPVSRFLAPVMPLLSKSEDL